MASTRIRPVGWLAAVLVIVLVVLAFSANYGSTELALEGQVYHLEVADDPREREQGLSDRPSLAANAGMIFVFDRPGRYGIWMKDTRFALDVIWLDEEKRIVHLEPNLSPDSYPQAFYPPADSLYVIELPAGTIAKEGLSLGQSLKPSIISAPPK